MKRTLFTIILTLLCVSTVYLPFSYAQNYRQMGLPDGAKTRLGKGWISGGIAYSPDGTKLAVPSAIGIWIYDANTFAEVALLSGHTAHVNSVAFSPDSKKLVSGSQDKTVRLWNVETGELIHILQEHTNVVLSVAFSPDGNTIASGDDNRTIWVWDAHTNQMRYKRRRRLSYTYGSEVYSLAFSPDSNILASGVRNNTILLWDVSTGELLRSTGGHEWGVRAVAFSSDGITLASGDGDGRVRLWGARTGNFWQRIGNYRGDVTSLAFSPDGKILAGGFDNNIIRIWDAFTGERLRTLEGHTTGVLGVAFSPDGRTLASASWTEIRFWNTDTWIQKHSLTDHTRSIYSIAIAPYGSTLATGSQGGIIHLWNTASGEYIHTFYTETVGEYSIAFSPDGSMLAITGSNSRYSMIHLWNVLTRELLYTFQVRRRSGAKTTAVFCVAFSPDGKTLAGGTLSYIHLWDVVTREYVKELPRDSGIASSLSFSPDGQMLASASAGRRVDGRPVGTNNGGIRLWHLRTGRRLKTFVEHNNHYAVAFSPDGNTIAGGFGSEIGVWNVRSGELLQRLTGHSNRYNIFSVAFSPNGDTLASASGDGTVRLWDTATGNQKRTFAGHNGSVMSIAFSPDDDTLASGSWDGTVLLWELTPTDTTSTPTTSNATISLSPATVQSPAIGEKLTFSLNITAGENVAGYQATVQFDTTALKYVESANSDYLPAGAFAIPATAKGNAITLAASSLAGKSNGDGTLATITFEVVAVKASTLTLSNVLLTDSTGGSFTPQTENAQITEPTHLPEDVNKDGVVNIIDLTLVASNFGQTDTNAADVNGDGVVNIIDLTLVAGAFGNTAAAPEVWSRPFDSTLTKVEIEAWLREARQMNLTDPAFQHGIQVLEQLLARLTPKQTVLLSNYPNPFNPETWIPYQLAEPANVRISIYAADGKRVRTLEVGHQPIGVYESRSRAAYWDGRNQLGEPVASGVYFYTLTAGEFTATRKMLIRK